MTYLLDTNVVSEWAKPHPEPGVVRWLATVDEDRVCLSVLTLAELEYGIARLPAGVRRSRLGSWLADEVGERFGERVLGITREVACDWGRLCARLEQSGHTIGVVDGFLAATARVHHLTLVTRNVRDFAHVGVELLNPWNSPGDEP